MPDRAELVGDLRAAEHRHERAGRRIDRAAEIPELRFQQPSRGPGPPFHGFGHRHHRGVGTMRRAEGVLAVDVTVGREPPREFGVGLLLAGWNRRFSSRMTSPGSIASTAAAVASSTQPSLGQPSPDDPAVPRAWTPTGLQRERRFEPGSRRPAQMTHQHARPDPIENRSNGGNRGPDPAVVRDLTLGRSAR